MVLVFDTRIFLDLVGKYCGNLLLEILLILSDILQFPLHTLFSLFLRSITCNRHVSQPQSTFCSWLAFVQEFFVNCTAVSTPLSACSLSLSHKWLLFLAITTRSSSSDPPRSIDVATVCANPVRSFTVTCLPAGKCLPFVMILPNYVRCSLVASMIVSSLNLVPIIFICSL